LQVDVLPAGSLGVDVLPVEGSQVDTCAAVTGHDKRDTCYLVIPIIPTWSDLVRSHAGLARSTMLQLAPVWLM
jgi:hypothetical protein